MRKELEQLQKLIKNVYSVDLEFEKVRLYTMLALADSVDRLCDRLETKTEIKAKPVEKKCSNCRLYEANMCFKNCIDQKECLENNHKYWEAKK